MALTPTFRIIANNKEITSYIQNNLLSIKFDDEIGIKSDRLEIKIYGTFKKPKYKDELKLYISYQEWDEELFCGTFIVQNSSFQKEKNILTISATATNFSNNLKILRNRSFVNKNICNIIKQIATCYNLKFKCDYDDIHFSNISQTHESDLSFLKRLSQKFNAIFTIKNDTMVFVRQDEQNSLPIISIDSNQCSEFIMKSSNKTYYKSIVLQYHNTKENKIDKIKIGYGDPTYYTNTIFNNITNLQLQAKSKLQLLNKGCKKGYFKTSGLIIYAGYKLRFKNLLEEDGNIYQVDKVTHTIDQNGWQVTVNFSNL